VSLGRGFGDNGVMRAVFPTSIWRLAVTAVVLAGCEAHGASPPSGAEAPVPPRPDGERGHGWFRTDWGVEKIDYEWRDGWRVYESDLVLDADATEVPPEEQGRAEQALLAHPARAWPMGADGVVTIPYELSTASGVTADQVTRTRDRVRRAMDHWQAYVLRPDGGALLHFEPRRGQAVYVDVQIGDWSVCKANNNNPDGVSWVHAKPGCSWQVLVHELGHVLTYAHEQRRTDRADYVIYHADRVRVGYAAEYRATGGDFVGTTYDSSSIMHYPSCMFARSACGRRTPDAWVLERRTGERYISDWWDRSAGEVLSPTDVCGTLTMYGLGCARTVGDPDAGVPPPDAGSPDASRGDAGTPDAGPDGGVAPGLSFPVSAGVPGMLQRVTTGECATPGAAGVGLATCDEGAATHRWGLTSTAALRNEGSALCAVPASAVAGAIVEQRACAPEPAQHWRFGDVELVNGSAGTCIAVPATAYAAGQGLVHEICSGAENQRFAFNPQTHQLLARGWCVTAGAAAGGRVELHDCDGGPLQRWIETGGGFAAAALCLHIRNGARSAPGAAIDVDACNGMVGQMWGLRGRIAHFDDEVCLSPSGAGEPLELAPCASSEEMVWWPRAACIPLSCADLGAPCGSFDDGCGNPLECGMCVPTPGGLDAGVSGAEDCTPLSCEELGAEACGMQSDGCGGTLDCGACPGSAGDCGCRAGGAPRPERGALVFAAILLATWAVRRRRAPARAR